MRVLGIIEIKLKCNKEISKQSKESVMVTNIYFIDNNIILRLIKIEDSILNNQSLWESKIEDDESNLVKLVWLIDDSRI